MGCDIHLHIEISATGQWHHWATPSVARNYDLFGKMAGVRSDIEPIASPRGLPIDTTIPTRLDYERMKEDAHTASWLNKDEIEELSRWLTATYAPYDLAFDLEHVILHTYLFGNSITDMAHGVDDVRFVFWFDN